MCLRINDTAFTPPRGFRYGTYSQQTNRHHPHLYKPGTTPCGAFPVFPARPPRRRARADPFPAACPGAAGRPAGAPPVPMGSGASRRGPSSWRPPPIPRMREDRAPDHRIRIPPVRRSGRGSTDTNGHGEGREEGGEGTDGCPNG